MRTKRIDEIELYIREKKSVSLDTLCEVFNVSKNTIRRDIATLEQSGKIKFMGALRSQIFLPQRCCFLFPHAIKA